MTTDGGGWALLFRYSEGEACPAPWVAAPRGCRRADGSVASESGVNVTPQYAFSELRGEVRGFGFGGADAFRDSQGIIDGLYVDGFTVTTVAPRTHLFTFAQATSDNFTNGTPATASCPCFGGAAPAPFIGLDYLCEAPRDTIDDAGGRVFDEVDVLFDGANIDDASCVGSADSAPSFQTSYATPVASDVELRLMQTDAASNEDFELTRAELWIR